MKRTILLFMMAFMSLALKAQVTNVGSDFKVIVIPNNPYGDYTRSVILLHEAYNSTLLNNNYAIGTITARRGNAVSFLRLDVAHISTSSGYDGLKGTVTALNGDDYQNNTAWKLKTCTYMGKKYIAAEVPYGDAHHAEGFNFSGFTVSTGESMKCVAYQNNGAAVNQNLISNIQDFVPNMKETINVMALHITGNGGIGIPAGAEKLAVNGKFRAHEVKVETANWPDYVFEEGYQLPSLEETEKHIKANGHLQGIPSAKEVSANGIELGEMNKKLLQKIEELTLHLIEIKKDNSAMKERLNNLEKTIKP